MLKRIATLFIVLIFILTSTNVIFPIKTTYAYQNNAYYNNIRIGLKGMAATSLNITLNGSYSVNGQVIASGTTTTLTINGSYVIFNGISYDTLVFAPQNKGNTLSITSGSTVYKYLGTLSFKVVTGKIFPINLLNIEDYLKGVVGLEMSDYFPAEALKSQAVAARTYTLSNIGLYNSSGYDLTDTPECQSYGGYNDSNKNIIKAVDDTRGQVQLYNDALIQAYYSASNGGYTEASENVWVTATPYLKSKVDSYENENWPGGNRSFTNAQIEATLISKGYLASTDKFNKIDLSTISKYASGRISNIDVIYTDVNGVQGKKSFTKTKASSFLGLPSSLYTVTYDSVNSIYTFSGKGFGHGVGLSQMGAKYRAAAGQNYQQILNFYYDGSYTSSLLPSIDNLSVDKNLTITGQAINFNSSGKNGSGSGYLYKYVVSKDGNTVYTQDYSTSSTFTYIPSSSGSYIVTLYLKDKLSSGDFDDQKAISFTAVDSSKLNNFQINKTSTLVSQGITVTTSGTAGSGTGYSYKFDVIKDGTLVYTQDYSNSSILSYTPTIAGNYTVNLYIKDKISSAAFDDMKTVNFTAYALPIINTPIVDKSSVLIGQAVNITSSATLGSSSGYLYKFEIIKDGQTVYTKDFNNNSSLSYVPTIAGNYTANVYLKDNISTGNYDDMKTLSFAAYNNPQITATNVTGTMYEKRPVTINTLTSGGSPLGISYKYEVYKDGVLITSTDFSSVSTYSFTPSVYGNYTIKTYVKDKLSMSLYDNINSTSLTILREPVVVSVLPIYWGMRGTDVTQIQTALTNLGYSLGTIDGIFGSKTYNAVVSFQKANGIIATGSVDLQTLNALNNAMIAKLTK